MMVDLKDGRCRSCDSQLEIVDADDISMQVVCAECGDSYSVETDAFGDGCMTYYVGFMTGRMEGGEDDDA
jgi:transcription elongation factor Elf1